MTLAATLLTLTLGTLEVRLQPGVARPGDAVLVDVTGVSEAPSGRLGSAELVFLAWGDHWVAITGLSVELKPTTLALEITGEVEGGGKDAVEGELVVSKPNFRRRQLSVSKRFTSPNKQQRQRMEDDQRAFSQAFDRDFEAWAFDAPFAWPRQDTVGAPFGDLRLFNGKKQSQHSGTDLDGNTGEAVYASNDGEVVMVRDCFGSGNTVLLHHGGRLFTSYFHLSAFAVKEGQRVRRGELLGRVGKTGRVTGPHLHFGVKLDGRWVDPESVLRLEFPPISDRSTSPVASPGRP